MVSFFTLFLDFIDNLWNVVFMSVVFEIGDVNVSFGALILGFICIYMIVSFFWKGARS